jgi:polyisoprenoid-binding protein YceI
MRHLSSIILLGAAIVFSSSTLNHVQEWQITESYSVTAKSEKFDAIFKGLESQIVFDESNLSSSKITASIDANSINTGNGMRNKHAKQGLEASKYPKINFVSTSITKSGSGYEADGKLTIRDITKDIKIPFSFSKNGSGGVFAGKFSVVPADYGVKKSGTPDVFEIELNVTVTK